MSTRCPKCGFNNLPDSKFCQKCGQDLAGALEGNKIQKRKNKKKAIFWFFFCPISLFFVLLLYTILRVIFSATSVSDSVASVINIVLGFLGMTSLIVGIPLGIILGVHFLNKD